MKELDDADKKLRDKIVRRIVDEHESFTDEHECAITEAYDEGFDSGYEIGCEDGYADS